MESAARRVEREMTGKVYLAGAGPGDPGLVTVRTAELLSLADVVLYDRLVSDEILAMISKSAKKEYVGRKAGDDTSNQLHTNELMLKYASQGNQVVRLKGGDPIIFGRGGEEAEYLREHNIAYEIIPGITSAIASATYAGIPLTHRQIASSVVLVTGHEDPTKESEAVKWRNLAKSVDSIVIMMGLSRIGDICAQLIDGGLGADTPVAVIQNGTMPEQITVRAKLSDIADAVKQKNVRPPAIIIVGNAVSLCEKIGWRDG